MIERDVFHIRLKIIELQAERLIDPYLKTRPIAIISSYHKNGSILCSSDEAKEEGLMEGMKVSMVRKMNHRVNSCHIMILYTNVFTTTSINLCHCFHQR